MESPIRARSFAFRDRGFFSGSVLGETGLSFVLSCLGESKTSTPESLLSSQSWGTSSFKSDKLSDTFGTFSENFGIASFFAKTFGLLFYKKIYKTIYNTC